MLLVILQKQLQLHKLYKEYNCNPNVATKPETIITITLINFLKSLTNIAKKVKGMQNSIQVFQV